MALMHQVYIVIMLVYLAAWVVTVSGLAASQKYCSDHTEVFLPIARLDLFAELGVNCSALFRFPWWISCGSMLPLIMEALAMFAPPSRFRFGRAAPLFAAVVPLNVIMANSFLELAELPVFIDTIQARFEVTMSGFAITAGLATFLIIISPLCHDEYDDSMRRESSRRVPTLTPAEAKV